MEQGRSNRANSAGRATCRWSATSTATASTKLGVYRDGTWYIDTNGNGVIDAEDQVFQLGGPGDQPVVGDWNGDGTSEPGVYRDNSVPVRK